MPKKTKVATPTYLRSTRTSESCTELLGPDGAVLAAMSLVAKAGHALTFVGRSVECFRCGRSGAIVDSTEKPGAFELTGDVAKECCG